MIGFDEFKKLYFGQFLLSTQHLYYFSTYLTYFFDFVNI